MFKFYRLVLLFTTITIIPYLSQAKHLKVLFLGNSYTASNNLPQLVQDIASAYGDTLTYQAFTPGGQYLYAHASDGSVHSALQQQNWDLILMQEQSQIPTIPYYRQLLFMPGADSLRRLRNQYAPLAELRFFLTWGRENGGQQCNQGYCSANFTDFGHYQDTLTWAYQRAADSNSAAIAPVGEMWREVLQQHSTSLPPLDLFSSDGSHPNIQGSYLAGLTLYATLFEVPALSTSPQVTNIDSSLDSFFRQIVDDNIWPRYNEWRLENILSSGQQCANSSNAFSFQYDNRDYEVISEMKSWNQAVACAASQGGKLVEINSQAEQDTVYSAITNGAGISPGYTSVSDGGGIAYVWIGATDRQNEGAWLWDGDADGSGTNFWNGEGSAGSGNGSPVSGRYNNWGGSSSGTPNEPDNFNGIQHGGAIGLAGWPSFNPGGLGQAGEWNDIDTANQLYYVIEYPCAASSSNITVNVCGSYTSPSGNYTWDSTGVYSDTLVSSNGCDSILNIDLTRVQIDTSLVQRNDTLISNALADTYTWINCNNSTPTAGANGNRFVPNSNGSYAVVLEKNDCIDTSACVEFTLTSTLEDEGGSTAQTFLFPNPVVNGFCTLRFGELKNRVNIKVTDISGRLILSKKQENVQRTTIDFSGQPQGLYLLMLQFEDGQHSVWKLINR